MDALTGPEYNLLPVYAAGPAIGPVRLGASYVSASRATRVGRDLYKAVPSPYGVRLVIADVQGKGLGTIRCAAVAPAAFRESGPEAEELAVDERAGPLLGESTPEEALRRVRADVAAFTGAQPDDDSALLLVEFAPRAVP
ncbi:hypothetical protein ABXI76_02040 [Streptomyces parvus]